MTTPPTTPWLTAKDAAAYVRRGRRFLLREIHAGRLRAARIGGRGEILTTAAWCDAWVTAQADAVPVPIRHGAAGRH